MLCANLLDNLVDPPYVLPPVDKGLRHRDRSLHLAPSRLLLGLKRLTVARLGAEVPEDAVDERPADRELGGYLLGRSLVNVEGPVDGEQSVASELVQLGFLLEVRSHAQLHPLVLEHDASLLAQGRVGALQLDGVGVDGVRLCHGPQRLGGGYHLGLSVDVGSNLRHHLAVVKQLILRQGFGLLHQFLLFAFIHLGVKEHQLLHLRGLNNHNLLSEQSLQVRLDVEDLCILGRVLLAALDPRPVGDLSAFPLLFIRYVRIGVAALVAGGQVDEPVQGALPRLPGGPLVASGVLHLLVVSEADPVGGYPFLPVDLVGAEANLVNREKDLLCTYIFVANRLSEV